VASQAGAPPLPVMVLDSYPPAAREAITRAYRDAASHDRDADRVGTFGRVLQAWEQWETAHGAYARAQALAPRGFEWHYLDGIVLQRLGRPVAAAARFEAALAITPEYAAARVKLAEARLDAGRLDEAQRLFMNLTDPDAAPAAAFGLGRIAALQGRHEAAIDYFQRAIALFPEFGAAHYALALSYRSLGRRDDAAASLAQHSRFGARWPAVADPVLAAVNAVREDPGALLQRGVKLADAGDVDGAIAAHEAALAVDPSLAQAHANLIGLYGRQRSFTKADDHYRAVVALGVNVADAHYDYGVLLGLEERWDDAAGAYRRALAMNPLHAEARNNLGQILESTRQFEAAMAEYRLAVDARPGLRVARFNLGRMLIGLGRAADAVRELQPLTEPRDAEAPRYLFALSTAYVRAGEKSEGVKWATAARDLALKFGDSTLAAAIDRDLASIR
ncbi:MAG: tetratricopeptide repeat protein, partial [Vicinamibacterales bacterium]